MPCYDKADYEFKFTKAQMEELHINGGVLMEVEKDGEKMNILFTYNNKDPETEELEKAYSNLTKAMLDDELDNYIDKLTDSLKKL
jgi:predicted TIM-barrel fold metal-dependent hydrolase